MGLIWIRQVSRTLLQYHHCHHHNNNISPINLRGQTQRVRSYASFLFKNFCHKNDNADNTEVQWIEEMKYSLKKGVGYIQILFLPPSVFLLLQGIFLPWNAIICGNKITFNERSKVVKILFLLTWVMLLFYIMSPWHL